jgi:hypothetical protein
MPKFKKGEKVVCINAGGYNSITKGAYYAVVDTASNNVELEEVQGLLYPAVFFTSAEERPNTVDEPIADRPANAMTLPAESARRKDYPLLDGCIRYFPAALAGVSLISKKGNDKHNPGEELHHARGKSMDHGDCILRHLIDVQDLLAESERSGKVDKLHILEEVSQMVWRALAYSQELHEKLGSPLAPGAKK